MNILNRISHFIVGSFFRAAFNKRNQILISREIKVNDVSFWQGNINFQELKNNNSCGVIIRAGQGNWIDSRFIENYKNLELFINNIERQLK